MKLFACLALAVLCAIPALCQGKSTFTILFAWNSLLDSMCVFFKVLSIIFGGITAGKTQSSQLSNNKYL